MDTSKQTHSRLRKNKSLDYLGRNIVDFLVLILCLCTTQPVSSTNPGVKFTRTPDNQTVLEQGEVLFFCSVNVSDVVITWFVNDVRVTMKKHNFVVMADNGRSTLEILQTKKKDQGDVICRISLNQANPNDYILSSAPVYLNVLPRNNVPGFPKCSSVSTPQVFEVDRQAAVVWYVDGSPAPEVFFVKDHWPLDVLDPRMRIFVTDGGNYVFQVDKAVESDSGKYTCVATNHFGSAYSGPVPVFVKRRLVMPYFSIKPEHKEIFPGEDVNLTCVAVGSPMPQVKWLNGSQELNEVKEGRNVLELKDVQVSSNLTCLAYSELGELKSNVYLHVKVSQNAPEDLKVVEVTATSARLQWRMRDEGNRSRILFHVNYRPVVNGSASERQVGSNQILLINLKPFTEYSIGVKSESDSGMSRPTYTRVTTRESVPQDPPQAIRATSVGPDSISVSWEEPLVTNGIITGYRVYFDDSLDKPLTSWTTRNVTDRSVVLEDLQPEHLYQIVVQASTSAGVGPASEKISILMKEKATPEPPRNVVVDAATSKSVRLTWRHSISSDVTSYLVRYGVVEDDEDGQFVFKSSLSVPASTDDRTVEHLIPHTVYEFQVAAQSSRGISPYSEPLVVKTLEEAPDSAPENLHAEAVDSTTIRISWKPIAKGKTNGKILGYRVFHSTVEASRSNGEAELDRLETGVTINIPYPEQSLVLRNLQVWSRHKFKVAGYTGMGDGPWSHSVTVRTFEDVPGVPRRLKLVVQSSTSVLVMWRSPLEQNGLIQGYQVFYLELDGNEQVVGNQLIHDVGNGSLSETLVAGLKPGTSYDFQVAAYTRRGDGPRSKYKRIKTMIPAIGQPQNFQLFLHQANPYVVRGIWDPPARDSAVRGIVQGYKVVYQAKDSNDENVEEIFVGDDARKAISKPLLNGVEYEFQVMAKSSNEYGPPAFASVNVPEGTPSEPPKISSLKRLSSSTAWVSWEALPPERWNGQPTGYKVRLVEEGTGVKEIMSEQPSATETTLNNLKPNATYVVRVSSCTGAGCSAWSDAVELKTLDLEGLSKSSGDLNLQPPEVERVSSATALVKLRKVFREMPNGKYYLVVVKEDLAEKHAPQSFTTSQLLSAPRPSPAWICSQFLSTHFPVEFLVGDGMSDQLLTNRKLDLDSFSYRFFTRLVTPSGDSFSSNYSSPVGKRSTSDTATGYAMDGSRQGGAPNNFFVIIVPICAAFLLGLVLVFAIVCFKKRSAKAFAKNRQKGYKFYRNKADASEAPLNPSGRADVNGNPFVMNLPRAQQVIPVNRLAERIGELKRNEREMLRNEYESIDSEKQFTWIASNLEENRHKNRYANVVAYDHSRVVLQSLGYPGSDYINANYIDGQNGKNVYIATQGPMPDTYEAFWRMVLESNCSTVVMITKLEERNRIKCGCYWPQHGSEAYGKMQVTLKDVLELASYSVRTFTLSARDFLETREVFQLQFTAWPDHGVPEYPTLLLQFIRRMKAANSIRGGPIVVHCSAGVGRTGALIAIDICLDQMLQFGTIDVLNCVTRLRSQRNYMVQSDDQYQFIYEALLEAAASPGETEVSADQLCAHIQDIRAVDPKTGFSRLSFEYQKLSLIGYDQSQFQIATLAFNKNKNRISGVVPLDSNRVCLQPIRGVDGSDYINASFVDGYKNQQSYIAAQSPTGDTVNDFWRMVWEHNGSIIVMLTNLMESGIERCCQYWPNDRSMRYQYFVLDPVTTINIGQYFVREFKMTDARDGQSRIIYHFQFVDWSQAGHEFSATGQQFINFIGQVENMRGKVANNGPIIVHCSSGAGRTGVFVALNHVLERMRTEGVVNLFETTKILRTQRPFMIQTEEQYGFCYQAASEYLTSFDHYT